MISLPSLNEIPSINSLTFAMEDKHKIGGAATSRVHRHACQTLNPKP